MSAWLRAAAELVERIATTQRDAIERASELCARAIASGSVVYTFGSGHSRIPVEEMFPRYGSYPGFVPMSELSTTFYTNVAGANGLLQAMHIERQSGLAELILASWDPRPPAAMMVFSASGTTAVPVELAAGARSRGMPVIAVTAVDRAGGADRARLDDHADVVVDLCTSDAEGLALQAGSRVPIGPGSTLAYVCVVNAIKVRAAELLIEVDALPPVIAHPGAVGEGESGASIRAAIEDHARRLRLQGGSGTEGPEDA